MKTFLLTCLLLAGSLTSFALPVATDTVIVNFGEGSRIIILLSNQSDAEKLKKIDFEELVQSIGQYLEMARKSENQTLTVNDQYGEYTIRIEDKPADQTNTTASSSEEQNSKEEVRVWRPADRFYERYENEDGTVLATGYMLWTDRLHLDVGIGLNNYYGASGIPYGTDYDLRPGSSRFTEVIFRYRQPLTKEKRTYFNYGLSLSTYRFRFEGDRRAVMDADEIAFVRNPFPLRRSRLSATYLSIPLTFEARSKTGWKIAGGGYAGYRIGSSTRIVYEEDGHTQRQRVRDSYSLSNFRYGLRGELGYRKVILFFNYDLNPVFDSRSSAPELQAFSFGLKL